MTEGPPLERLTQRLQACPAAFLRPPRIGDQGEVVVEAIVADVLRRLAGDPLARVSVAPLVRTGRRPKPVGALRLALVTAWLVADDAFLGAPEVVRRARTLFEEGLEPFAEVVPADDCVTDAGRREELARYVLSALSLRPQGETDAQAADRLATLDTVARLRVVRESQLAEERARRIREAMERKAREEAAAKAMRE